MPSALPSWSSTLTQAKDRQVGGTHYKEMAIQPGEYITKNKLNWYEGNVIKYVTRHQSKNGRQDIQKAIHYLELMLEQYDELYPSKEEPVIKAVRHASWDQYQKFLENMNKPFPKYSFPEYPVNFPTVT